MAASLKIYIPKLQEETLHKEERKKGKKKAVEDTLIASWFKDKGATEEPEFVNPNTRLSRLHSFLSSKRNLIYCAFIIRIVPVFERANVALQAEAPMITKTRAILLWTF